MQFFRNFRLFKIHCRVVTDLLRHNSYSKHLLEKLKAMPKHMKHVAELQKQRQKIKDKTANRNANHTPSIVYLQVIGSGATGAPRSLYMFTDQTKYLFNCGEGTQRLAHEHRIKLTKLEQVFVTYPTWENIGGLPGLALTLQDVGVPEINIHGSQVIDDMFESTRKFVILHDMKINVLDAQMHSNFEDSTMTVTCVALCLPSSETLQRSPGKQQVEDSSTDDDIEDYYAYERNFQDPSPLGSKNKEKKRWSHSVDQNSKRHCSERPGCISVAYICRLKAKAGALSLEACVERGVPPGPLLGVLKSGQDIILEDGTIVYSKDVTSPDDPGAVFIVVECPTVEFLSVLLKEPAFIPYQKVEVKEDIPFLIIHFTPDKIMQDPRYKEWMGRFSSITNHMVMNESNKCMGSTAVHRIQYKLNLLDKEIFCLLRDDGIPFGGNSTSTGEESTSPSAQMVTESETKLHNIQISGNANSVPIDAIPGKVVKGQTLCTIKLRPSKEIDMSNKLVLLPRCYIAETLSVQGFKNSIHQMKYELNCASANVKEYPKILFLGTGSCIPNKNRNTSGILLEMSKSECMLMDCGEGTFGQLVRYFGTMNWLPVVKKLKAIYISHLHADHHIGLIGILKAWRRADVKSTLYLIAPKQIMTWLHIYNYHFEQVLDNIKLVPSNYLVYNMKILGENDENELKKALNVSSILTAPVKHCPNAFGVAVTHADGWKITYSGDTMPCRSLIELGMDSDVLIHEATMEDDLAVEAQKKRHSTTTQAIQVGQDMKAKFILLTHFSQRYAKIPRFNDRFSSNIGIAFDNMQVRLSDMPKLPFMYPPLKLMFAEHHEELEQKAVKRQLKLEREALKGAA